MAFTYGGITYHTDEQDPNPLRNLITGAGLQGSGTPSYYAPVDYSQYLNPNGSINWQSLPDVIIGGRPVSASNLAAVGPGVNLFNPSYQTNDPNFGAVTSIGNVNNTQWSDYLGPIIGMAMGAGFGALAPVGAGLFSSLPKIASSFDQSGTQGGAMAALPQILNVLRNW